MDDYVICYAPSAYALDAAQRRMSQRNGHHAGLIAGVSKYVKMNSLPNTAAEAAAIAEQFVVPPLLDSAASREAIIQAAPGKAYLHLACHGAFAWGDAPLASALFLTNDEPLPLSEIISKLKLDRSRLVTLSACGTGITDVSQSPDEYLGLPAGFMQAGAPGVVSSLWTVADLSTALLMERFYQFHRQDGLTPTAALRKAHLWLRDTTAGELEAHYESYLRMSAAEAHTELSKITMQHQPGDRPYTNPYFWAAFTFNGV